MFHAGGNRAVASLFGRVEHGKPEKCLAALLGEDDRCNLFARLRLAAELERFRANDLLGWDDFAIDAAMDISTPSGPRQTQ